MKIFDYNDVSNEYFKVIAERCPVSRLTGLGAS